MLKYVTDTSSLMEYLPQINFEEVIINTLVLQELEKHKNDSRFPEKQKKAKKALYAIEENESELEFDFKQYPSFTYLDKHYDINYTDNRLLESLFHYKEAGRNVGLMSEDLSLRIQARAFGFPVKTAENRTKEQYQGTKVIHVNDPRVCDFYKITHDNSEKQENIFDLLYGQYLLLKDNPDPNKLNEEKLIGAWKWDGQVHKKISMNQRFSSMAFAEVTPKNYRQAIAMDSMKNNALTVITGKAGTGKSYLAFGYIMEQIERFGRPVYIVTNNVPLRGTNTFGLKKGGILEKILQSNLGNIIQSKIGIDTAKRFIDSELLRVVALEDIRGVSFNSILYITEVQNYTVDMLKTVLERLEEEGGQAIFDGDKRQIDVPYAKGFNNGIDRLFEVFKGSPYLGHVELVDNRRGGISALADKM